MVPVQVRLTKSILKKIDELIKRGFYSNRSEIIRDATRRLLMELESEIATEIEESGQ